MVTLTTYRNIVICATVFTILKSVLCHNKQIMIPRGTVAKFNQFESKSLWRKNYEDLMTNIDVMPKRNNSSCATESSLDRVMEAIHSNDNQLQKIVTINYKIEEFQKTLLSHQEQMMTELVEINKQAKFHVWEDGKLDTTLKGFKADLNLLKYALDHKQNIARISADKPYREGDEESSNTVDDTDSRWSRVDATLKFVSESVQQILNILVDVRRRTILRGGRTGPIKPTAERYPSDCSQIQFQGYNTSGIYKIKPDQSEPFYVLCDFDSVDGGWTLFQSRFDGSQDFHRSWKEYKQGFGNLAGEFWLGLDKLHYLTNQKLYELRVELESHTQEEAYAAYSVFTVGSESEGYRISTLGNYHGTAGDSLSYHSGQKFSTFDEDNDEWKEGNCAVEHGGAWWYRECDKSNLNGKYVNSEDAPTKGDGVYWNTFKGPNYSLMKTRMMIRPVPAKPAAELLDLDEFGNLTPGAEEFRRDISSTVKYNAVNGLVSTLTEEMQKLKENKKSLLQSFP